MSVNAAARPACVRSGLNWNLPLHCPCPGFAPKCSFTITGPPPPPFISLILSTVSRETPIPGGRGIGVARMTGSTPPCTPHFGGGGGPRRIARLRARIALETCHRSRSQSCPRHRTPRVTGVSDARPQRAYSETTCTKRYLAENVRLGPRGPEREFRQVGRHRAA